MHRLQRLQEKLKSWHPSLSTKELTNLGALHNMNYIYEKAMSRKSTFCEDDREKTSPAESVFGNRQSMHRPGAVADEAFRVRTLQRSE